MLKPGSYTHPQLMPDPVVPRAVALELLWGCNLKCNYCYIGVEKNWRAPVVPRLSTLCTIIDKIVAAGVQEVYLVGGEPTAHPHFEKICEYLAGTSLSLCGVCTNGTLMTPQLAELLKKLNFYVDVSFRGDNAEIFDGITGVKGIF